MRKMRKILLGLGTIAMIGSPIIAVVSCSDDPTLTDFSYTYDGKAYADLESFGHDVFKPGTETEGKEVGIVHSGKTYKKPLTKEEVANLTGLVDDNKGQKNAYNLMLELAKFVELPPNIMSAFEAALKATFKSDGKHGNPPSGPGPGPTENSYTFESNGAVDSDTHEFAHKIFKDVPSPFKPGENIAIINGTHKYAKIVDIDEAKIFTDMILKKSGNAYNIFLELASFVGLPDADVKDYSTQVSNALKSSTHQGQITDFEFTYDGTTYTDDEDWYVNETGSSLYKFGQHVTGSGKRLVAKDIKIDHTKAGGTEYSTTLTAENITELDSILGIDPNPKDTFHYMEKLAEILQMTGSIQKTFHTYLRTFFAAP